MYGLQNFAERSALPPRHNSYLSESLLNLPAPEILVLEGVWYAIYCRCVWFQLSRQELIILVIFSLRQGLSCSARASSRFLIQSPDLLVLAMGM